MSRYILSKKMKKILEARGHNLVCKICECPILVGDLVESKQQRKGKCKFYHAKCYDDSMFDIPNGDDDDDDFFACPHWKPDYKITITIDKGKIFDFGIIYRIKRLFGRDK